MKRIHVKTDLIASHKRFFFTLIVMCIPSMAIAAPLNDNDSRIKAFENGLVDRSERGQKDAQRWSIEERLKAHGVPGASVAIIEDGKIIWSKGYGTKLKGTNNPVDSKTVFSVGSVSKMINAAIILRLVAEGKIDLDKDVNHYLKSWEVPTNQYTKRNKVTLRAILSHTAGFSQHGFADFQPGEKLPSAIETLTGSYPAKHSAVRLMFTPGTEMDYSGGGTTVSQVLVEDVTGLSYLQAATKYVFEPLAMSRSTFQNPLSPSHGNIARAHDSNGNPTALPRGWEAMPEIAASGLWTSADDLATFNIALLVSTKSNNGFLPPAIAKDMMTRVKNSWHGLGPRLNGKGETRVYSHGGANNSYRAWIEGQLDSGNGIVVLTNGTNGHRIHQELRKSAEDAFSWVVKSDGGFDRPKL